MAQFSCYVSYELVLISLSLSYIWWDTPVIDIWVPLGSFCHVDLIHLLIPTSTSTVYYR